MFTNAHMKNVDNSRKTGKKITQSATTKRYDNQTRYDTLTYNALPIAIDITYTLARTLVA